MPKGEEKKATTPWRQGRAIVGIFLLRRLIGLNYCSWMRVNLKLSKMFFYSKTLLNSFYQK
jgi:hypothetical protein